MSATVEILSGIVRAGPDHHKFGDPYTVSVAFSASEGQAVLKGLTGKLTQTEAKAIIKALKSIGLEPQWNRKK